MRPDDSMEDAQGGGRRGQYVTAAYDPVIIHAGRDVAPAEWWSEQRPEEAPSEFNVLEYWRIILKHRFVVLGVFAAAIAIGIAATLLMKPIYSAATTIQIDRESVKVVDSDALTPTDMAGSEEFFQTQYGLLKSRSLATRVVDNLGLARDGRFIKSMGLSDPSGSGAELTALRRKRATSALTEALSIRPVRGSRLVAITFDHPDPQLAARVANGVAEAFIQANLERRYESASYARNFLEDRLKQVKVRLEDSERQLVAYAANQQIINITPQAGGQPGMAGAEQTASQSLTATDLVAMNAALAQARGQRIAAEQRWRQSAGGDGASIAEVLQSPVVQNLRQQKAALQAQYEDKRGVYKADFPAMLQLKAQIDELDRQIDSEISTIRRSIRNQYQIAAKEEGALAAQVERLKSGVMDLRDRSIQYTILQREVDTNRTLYDGLLQRYKEVGVAGGVGANNISVVDRASPPVAPSRPRPALNIGIAALLGIIFGILAAFLLELLDESLQTPDDVESKLGLTLLGAIPVPPKGMGVDEALGDSRSPISEAYYSVRTALQFSTPTGVPQVLLVTSSKPAEGKSTTSRVVAQNFARLGMRVLLVDADLRNPSLHRMFETDNSKGLSNLLTGVATLDQVVQATDVPNLLFLPCGPLPPTPVELLGGDKLRSMLIESKAQFDLVVLDGPPVLGLADAPLLADAATGVLLVVAARETKRGQARAGLRRLQQGRRSKVIGAILTKYDAKRSPAGYGSGYGYAYSYDYSYGERPKLTREVT